MLVSLMISPNIRGFSSLKTDLQYLLHFYSPRSLLRIYLKKISKLVNRYGWWIQTIDTFLNDNDIMLQQLCPSMHQQNGCAEWTHRNIIELDLTLLSQAFMPLSFWWDAFNIVVYLINRLPTLILNNQSPMRKLFHQEPSYFFLYYFRCACFPHIRPYNKNKFDFHILKCLFVGYSNLHKGYKC